jgi:xeroderma pigmentosum group C-complementing protein
MPPFLPRKRLRSSSPEPEPEPSSSKGKGKAKLIPPIAPSPRKQTLFEALDAGTNAKRTPGHSRSLLAKLAGSDDESSLSSLSSPEPEFEDVPASKRQKTHTNLPSEDEDEDIEFEDVATHGTSVLVAAPPPSGDLDLTLTKETRISIVNPLGKKQGPSKIERGIRVATHQMHVQFLMWHNATRNAWACDKEVQKILVAGLTERERAYVRKWVDVGGIGPGDDKQTPKGKGKKHSNLREQGKSSNVRSQRDWGEASQRQGDSIDVETRACSLVSSLRVYWLENFRVTVPGLKKMGYMTLPRIDDEIKSFQRDKHDPEYHGERIANIDEFKECARNLEGSRDTGAQLFTALLRGIGLDARLVVSLQPVGFGWSRNEEAAERKKRKKAGHDAINEEGSSDENMEDVANNNPKAIPTAKVNAKTKTVDGKRTTRKSSRGSGLKDAPINLSESDVDQEDDVSVVDITPARRIRLPSKNYEKGLAPNYWTEILMPITQKWIPLSHLRPPKGDLPPVAKPDMAFFEPKGATAEKAKQVMAYIVGFSSDGTAKDVTVRYLKNHMWPGKTKGMRFPIEKVPIYNRHGKVNRYEESDWFKTVMSGYARRKITPLDDDENLSDLKAAKPVRKEVKEGEESLQYYKSSPEFVLERHLRREEALPPNSKPVKKFTVKGKGKGEEGSTEEPVFLRKDVVKVKSTETWHKEGREPLMGEQPLKRVPYRAATTNRKRELAEAEAASGGQKMLQGLYSFEQTDWIIPPPIENGIIPKNSFGNMDVYVPSMVPKGAVHIPRRGTVRICKKLGIDYAEAVTGFEFGARMAIPIITGVVVAEENEDMVWEQWMKDEAERVRKEDEKRTKAAIGMWRKFLMGLRIVARVREEYGDEVDNRPDLLNPWTNRNKMEAESRIMELNEEEMAGGFFPEGHDEESAQSFFPTRQEDDDDDGGFIVEGHGDQAVKFAESYAGPVSIAENVEDVNSDEETLVKKGKSNPVTTTASRTGKPTTKFTRKTTKRRAKAPSSEDEEAGEESSLSEPPSDSQSEVAEPPKIKGGKGRATNIPPAVVRAVPKRQAARKSETALRSHYFHHSDEE